MIRLGYTFVGLLNDFLEGGFHIDHLDNTQRTDNISSLFFLDLYAHKRTRIFFRIRSDGFRTQQRFVILALQSRNNKTKLSVFSE